MENKFYNYGGYIETKVLEYEIDNNDLQILSYIAMIYASDRMELIKYEDDYYVWLKAEKIVADNPRLRIKKRALETRIAYLVDKGLIKKVVKCDENNIKKTYYRITDKYRDMLFTYENVEKIVSSENGESPKEPKEVEPKDITKQIIDYLNLKSNKKFTYKNKTTIEYINGRLKEGRTFEDFKYVIDIKCSQWLKTSMETYLRPSTLFAPTNFENYLNENNTAYNQNTFGKNYNSENYKKGCDF